MLLSKRTVNQIIKNHETDSIESNFNKSIKYLEKNNISFEEAISVIIETQNSLKGLPILLIKENRIQNYEYMFNSISLNLLIEVYKKDEAIDILQNFILNNTNYSYLTEKLFLIKDKNILLNILQNNKSIFLVSFKESLILSNYESEYECINYLSFLNLFISKNTNNSKYLKLFNTILFEIEWTKEEIERLLYETNQDNNHSLISCIIIDYNFELFKKIVDKFGFDYEKSVPNQYSYYYIPLIPQLFLIDDRFSYNEKSLDKVKVVKQFLDLFIKLELSLFPQEMLKQTRSNDIQMDKMFGNKSCKGTISRGYYGTSKQIKNTIDDNEKDSAKIKTIELLKYYFENSNTLEKDNSFWSLTLVSNKELNSILLNVNKNIGKKWTYEEVRNALKNAIYSNKPENLHDF